MPIAVTDIKYSDPNVENAEVVYIEAGEEVKGLPSNVMDDLRESGSIADSMTQDDAERLRELEAEVEALRSQLASAVQHSDSTVPPLEGAPAQTNESGTESGAAEGEKVEGDNTANASTDTVPADVDDEGYLLDDDGARIPDPNNQGEFLKA
jgi:hypothetical protein